MMFLNFKRSSNNLSKIQVGISAMYKTPRAFYYLMNNITEMKELELFDYISLDSS
jgi:hypothetical protein